jgi:hypothetical protein
MRRLLVIVFAVAAVLSPTAAFASPNNGEICAVQTWDQNLVVSVHRGNYGAVSQAPRAQIDAAAGHCTNLAAMDGWMPADKNYDKWVGQIDICSVAVQPGLRDVIHAGSYAAVDAAVDMCIAFQADNPNFVTWL